MKSIEVLLVYRSGITNLHPSIQTIKKSHCHKILQYRVNRNSRIFQNSRIEGKKVVRGYLQTPAPPEKYVSLVSPASGGRSDEDDDGSERGAGRPCCPTSPCKQRNQTKVSLNICLCARVPESGMWCVQAASSRAHRSFSINKNQGGFL